MSSSTPLSPSERAAWHSVLVLADTLRTLVNQEINPRTGLSSADYLILVRLDAAPEHRLAGLKALAVKLDWSASRLSHQLKRMSKRGLVELHHEVETGVLVIRSTDAARETMRTATGLHAAAVRRYLLSVATPGELDAVAALADRVKSQRTDPGQGGA
jgi:DNA-binding MarR family transcriptional regulator